jgi:hypothetical protein
MAGRPKTRERADTLERENAELRRQLAQYAAAGVPKRSARAPRRIEEGPEVLAEEMLALADDGLSLDEIAARWNVSAETLDQWANANDSFAADLDRARTRARAVVLGVIRQALNTGRGLPAGMLDRVLALYSAKSPREADASGLVVVHLNGSQSRNAACSCCTGACQTVPMSDGRLKSPAA